MGMFFGGFLAPLILIVVFYSLIVRLIHLKSRSLQSALRIECKHQTFSLLSQHKRYQGKPILHRLDSSDRSVIEIERQTTNESFDLDINAIIRSQKRRRNGLTNVLVKRERQVTKTVVACVGFFCLSWFPYAIIVLIAQIGIDVDRYVTPLTATLPALFAKTSTIFNPLIYTVINSDCKVHFKRLFRIKERKPMSLIETNRLF